MPYRTMVRIHSMSIHRDRSLCPVVLHIYPMEVYKMKKWYDIPLALVLLLSTIPTTADDSNHTKKTTQNSKENEEFKLGVDVLLEENLDKLENKNVGLITNPTGVDQDLNSIIDVLYDNDDVNLVTLFGPE